MAPTTRIPPEQLAAYFDSFTKRFLRDGSPESVDVEIVGADWVDQYAIQAARLTGITYDRASHALELALDYGDHRVYQPREVWAVEEPSGFVPSIELVRAGTREVLTLRQVGLRRVR